MILDIPAIESLCANSCFVILFFTTLYYWLKVTFGGESDYNKIGLVGYGSSLLCLTTHLILRWVDSGHFPLSNLYESLLFLAWCLLILHIYIETSIKTLFLGVLTSPAILCLVAFTDFSLPTELQRSGPLVPALQSNWLVMHVTVMIASYAALLLGCLIAITYLVFSNFTHTQNSVFGLRFFSKDSFVPPNINKNEFVTKTEKFFDKPAFSEKQSLPLFSAKKEDQQIIWLNFSENTVFQNGSSFDNEKSKDESQNTQRFLFFLDDLSYRTIGIGFCFLTLGILSGAVWANETWGNYWSWDPKETWAFITWLTFACYLHSRLVGGWTGSKPAWIASFGFVIVWTCYLGVNLLGQGLHSYGFLHS